VSGELGILSTGDDFPAGDGLLVNGSERLSFQLEGDDYGDATQATFDFAELSGSGEVQVFFFDDGELLTSEVYDATSGQVIADLDGATFDSVRIKATDDTAFSLDSFAFDRTIEDDMAFV